MAGETCVLAALWGGWLWYQVLRQRLKPERKLRLLCCPQNGERAAVYNFRTVHSAEKWATVAVNLVDLQKIREVIYWRLIQWGKLEKGRKKTA